MFEDQEDDDVEEADADSDADGDEDMIDVDGEDSDVEVVDDDASTSSEEDEDEGEEEEEDAAEVADFEAKLAAALGTHRADADLNENESSGSDADMNDDEMEEIDAQLANVFRARRAVVSQHKDKKDARENMINFKNRVLDLLEIFVKKCHAAPLALDILLPLLRLTRRSTVKQIANKAAAVLREYAKLCKGSSVPSIPDQDGDGEGVRAVWALLRAVHKEAGHSGSPAHASACSQASLLVVKVLVKADKVNVDGVVDVYAETRKAQLGSTRCHVQPSFFTDWNNWCVSASKQLKG